MHIPGRTFPVKDYMLEDVLQATGYIPPKNKKKNRWQGHQKPRKATPWNDSEKSDEEGESADEAEKDEPSGPVRTCPSHSISIEDLVQRVDETDLG